MSDNKLSLLFTNKKIIVTGASSGIGKASAIKLAELGAFVILVARRQHLLQELADQIISDGGQAQAYAADLSDKDEIDALSQRILKDHPVIDVLFNNAGRSIRRPMSDSLERYHDFERCMTINYFSPVRLIRNFLPSLLESGQGHIINSSTWGTLLPAARFGPYNGSKIALDKISNTLRIEMEDRGLAVTSVHYPLVHTDMSRATKSFEKLPGMTTEEAADWVVKAILKRPKEVMDLRTRFGRMLYFFVPRLVERIARSSPFSV